MSEGQQFFLILCALYLSESVLWVKPRAWVFLSGWWGRWKVSEPMRRAGRGRFVMTQWLPPLGWGFVCGDGVIEHVGVGALRDRLAEFDAATARLHALAACLVLPWFFIVVPLTYWRFGATVPFWLILGAGWALLLATGVTFARAHRRLYPVGKGDERWTHCLLVSLVPQHAIRAPGLLARRWLAGWHPLAVAAAVLDRDAFQKLGARVWRELVFPRPGQKEGDLAAERARVEAILRETEVATESFILPPERTGDAVAYCPRCHVLFQDPGATCEDCGGRAIIRLP